MGGSDGRLVALSSLSGLFYHNIAIEQRGGIIDVHG